MNRYKYQLRPVLATIHVLALLLTSICAAAQTITLNGQWHVSLDTTKGTDRIINLPGTLDDAGIGQPVTDTPTLTISSLAHLSRKYNYIGKAYYSRKVRIPADWKGKHIVLTLGRILWRSQVSIDGVWLAGENESLVTSHEYNLTDKLTPGHTHTLTVMVDNSNIYPGINIYERKYPDKESYEMAHAYTNHTQIKWNGILGDITLQARPATFLQQVNIYPDLTDKKIKIVYDIRHTGKVSGQLTSYVIDPATKRRWEHLATATVTGDSAQAVLAFAPTVNYWNASNPKHYQLVTVLRSESGNDTVITPFGLRDLRIKDRDLYLNGQRLFIRGNLECVIFPLKGYPPMDRKSWRDLYTKAKNFGLNSFRFHSWCPPPAAFEAADEVGFYLQVELPHWNLNVGKDTASFAFLRKEAKRIIQQYGNHPSFLFFSMGNELEGDFNLLNNLVHELKAADQRHLYATTSFTFQKDITGRPQPEDDFFVTQWTKDGWVRGQGVFNDQSPEFTKDFSSASENVAVPLITHEIGQYSVYPDLSEIPKYTGNLVPNNLIAIKRDLEKKGRLSFAPAFLNASGKLAALLYKEEIERALKTAAFDGFQLLQLQDFPGQGTALVGMLNAFWQPKGFITREEFSRFNNDLTPLIRFPKAIYLNSEHFVATVELANFLRPLKKAAVYWTINTESGKPLAEGIFEKADYPVGNRIDVGKIDVPLNNVTAANRLVVKVGVKGTKNYNQWNVWVYPAASTSPAGKIVVTDSYTAAANALDKGQSVLLSPRTSSLKGIEGRFVPVFWSPVHFPDQPGTMGQLIKSGHPALQQFPTEEHTDWQWWDLVKKSKALNVDNLPDTAVIVRVIDNFVNNGNLATLFEVRVGNGKLIFSGMDLLTDTAERPAARQLYNSLLHYMKSSAFNPKIAVPMNTIKNFTTE